DYASIEQLLVLINLENTNALLIKQFVPQNERLIQLRNLAVEQLLQLSGTKSISRLNELHNQEQLPNK
ncbi:MAG: KilA-N domain-containing protein, partial [Oscillospiraceae bacterium]